MDLLNCYLYRALLRPGRLETRVELKLPDYKQVLIKHHVYLTVNIYLMNNISSA